MLVGEQFDAIVQGADRTQQIVAETRAKQGSEFVGFHAREPLGLESGGFL
jgi:hypothetical protein